MNTVTQKTRVIKSVYSLISIDHNKNGERTVTYIIHYGDGTNEYGGVKDQRIFSLATKFILQSNVLATIKTHTFNTLYGVETTTVEYKSSDKQSQHVYYIHTGCRRKRVCQDIFECTIRAYKTTNK